MRANAEIEEPFKAAQRRPHKREEAHRQRCPKEKNQGPRLGDGQELPRECKAAFAPTTSDPAPSPFKSAIATTLSPLILKRPVFIPFGLRHQEKPERRGTQLIEPEQSRKVRSMTQLSCCSSVLTQFSISLSPGCFLPAAPELHFEFNWPRVGLRAKSRPGPL